MQLAANTDRFSWFLRLATFVLVVWILRIAQDVLVPVAFAVLLAFLLSPLVVRLMRWGFPRTVAIIVTVTIAFGAIGGVGWIVTRQAISLARELPNYEGNLRRKIDTLKHPRAPSTVTRMSSMVENLSRELKAKAPDRAVTPPTPESPKPVPVEVKESEPTPWEIATGIVGPILRPLGIAGIVIVFVVAMLFQREDLRDRFIKLVSAGQLNIATQAVEDAANRVSRYLGMQLIVNATYGIPIGVGLYFIGIPNALLWGLLATLLRFIPFVGPWIAASFPCALAIAVDPGWTKILYTGGLFVVMELISNNLIEVVLYGASTGISNLALLVAAVFWTWLWGPAGLALSTPLTVCVLVLGNYVPGLNFLSMLLGSEPVLEPPSQLYQRMLSMESEDVFDLAEKHIEEHSVEEFYANVFVPALLLSEEDRHSGTLPEMRQRFIFQSSRELVEELERQDEMTRIEAAGGNTRPAPVALPAPPAVLIAPARDEADEIVALMLKHLLQRRGIASAVNALTTPLSDAFAAIDRGHVKAVAISALPPSAVSAARQVARRVRQRYENLPLLVGVWHHRAGTQEIMQHIRVSGPTELFTTLEAVVEHIEGIPGTRRTVDVSPPRTTAPAATPQGEASEKPPQLHRQPGTSK